MHNKITLVGVIQHTPELRYTENGTPITKFTLRTWEKRGGEYQTEWHDCVAFGKTAESIHQYCQSGSSLIVWGRLTSSKYESKKFIHKETGAPATMKKWEVLLDGFSFVTLPKETDGEPDERPAPRPQASRPQASRPPALDDIPDIVDPWADENSEAFDPFA